MIPSPPHFLKVLNLISSAKSLLPPKIPYSLVPGIWVWTPLGGQHASVFPYPGTHTEGEYPSGTTGEQDHAGPTLQHPGQLQQLPTPLCAPSGAQAWGDSQCQLPPAHGPQPPSQDPLLHLLGLWLPRTPSTPGSPPPPSWLPHPPTASSLLPFRYLYQPVLPRS